MRAVSSGIHFVRKSRSGGRPCLWYVYAWRGGPQIVRAEGGVRPALTPALIEAAGAALAAVRAPAADTLAGLIHDFRASPEWRALKPSSRSTPETWLTRIGDVFGTTPLHLFDDRRMRGEILAFRDRWAHQPRSADYCIQTFHRLLWFGQDRGRLTANILHRVENLYEFDRSELIWEAPLRAAFERAALAARWGEGSDAKPHTPRPDAIAALAFACATGLRRGDLVAVPWEAVGDHAIVWDTAKSRGRKRRRRRVTVPLLPETRALLDGLAAELDARGKPRTGPILRRTDGQPWTASHLSHLVLAIAREAKIERHLHDARGTFATLCMTAPGGMSDKEIAELLGWSPADIKRLRDRYVPNARVVIELGKRIASAAAV